MLSTLAPPRMERLAALEEVLWLAGAAGLGFAISGLFSGLLRLPRTWFVAAYLLVAGPFLLAYLRSTGLDPMRSLARHWLRGLAGAVLVGSFMVWSMQRQPASPPPAGAQLVFAVIWLGIVYALLDATFLTILPVVATWRLFKRLGWTARQSGRIAAGATGMLASFLITATYHLGFAEYHGAGLVSPLFGNGVLTLGYLLTGNPITALGAHVALHVASALHGIDTTVTLPPHY